MRSSSIMSPYTGMHRPLTHSMMKHNLLMYCSAGVMIRVAWAKTMLRYMQNLVNMTGLFLVRPSCVALSCFTFAAAARLSLIWQTN
mmetsp:Transcript_73077/g.190677  ORF Transcript_73077/g.190677 Transcript_73077/m.190677 type:complete len:86 (-) Transcript_73077:239-496(-)